MRTEKVSPSFAVSPVKVKNLGRMIQAVQTWLASHRQSHAAALFLTACVALLSLLFGTTEENICAVPVVEPRGPRGMLWRRRRNRAMCSDDPFADSDTPPPTFLEGVSKRKAQENWEKTRIWRRENNIGSILQNAPRRFDLIRKLIPVSLYQHDREGNIVMVEKWGESDPQQLKQNKLSHNELIYAYMFETEWLWSVANPKPNDKITLIMDVGNVTFEQFTSWENMRLVKERINIGTNHYPNRAAHLLIVNVPPFFTSVYRFAEPLLSPQTKKRLTILSEEDVKKGVMTKIIHPRQLLKEYGGKCKVPFGQSAADHRLKRQVNKAPRRR